MKKLDKKTWIAILCVCVIVLGGAGFFLFRYLTQSDIKMEELIPPTQSDGTTASAPTAAGSTSAPTVAPTQPETFNDFGYETAELGDYEVSFDELMEINPDIYAWIYIPNTNIDYPVAQSMSDGDDGFYLEHNVYRQYQFSGTIYSEVQNHPDFHDRVTVLYGHNMLNGSMFATLHNFEDEAFFNENNTVFIMTKDKQLTYLVYSAYTYDDRHILNSFDISDDETFQEYLDSTLDPHTYNGNVREGVELNTNNKILTLSTCTSGASNTRYLVQGVLVDERDR